MTVADITLAAFTLCNSARVVAYVPQITKAATDENSAQAISFTTWGLFLFSNTSAYARVNNRPRDGSHVCGQRHWLYRNSSDRDLEARNGTSVNGAETLVSPHPNDAST